MTGLTVQVDRTEYSKFHPDMAVVNANLTFQEAVAGDTVTASLVRLDGYGVVTSKTLTLAANQNAALVQFDLRTINGPEGFNICRQGYYQVQATSGSLMATSQTFWVGVVPVKELKERWCYGVPLTAMEVLAPKLQPQQVSGVTVKKVPNTHPKGIFSLAYNATSRTLSWAGGPAVPVQEGVIRDYILVNQAGTDYIVVTINPSALPAANVTEQLVIDNAEVDDQVLRQDIEQAYNEIYQKCYFYPEPTYVATDPNTTASGPQVSVTTGWADVRGIPVTYYRMRDFMRWMTVKLPYNRILKVLSLTGWFNETLTLTVTPDWIVWNEMNGELELVPKSGAVVSWQFYQSAMLQFLYIYNSIPSFWHYWILCGLPTLEGEFSIVREAIAKLAAVNALTRAGAAFSGGHDSLSTSRDGVSMNRSFGKKYPWQPLVEEYQLWLYGDKGKTGNLKRIKDRLVGPQFVVI
ncbi:MAG: hypothetical protein ACPL5F_01415 [Moorellaceae bacterium]